MRKVHGYIYLTIFNEAIFEMAAITTMKFIFYNDEEGIRGTREPDSDL